MLLFFKTFKLLASKQIDHFLQQIVLFFMAPFDSSPYGAVWLLITSKNEIYTFQVVHLFMDAG